MIIYRISEIFKVRVFIIGESFHKENEVFYQFVLEIDIDGVKDFSELLEGDEARVMLVKRPYRLVQVVNVDFQP